MKSPTSIHPTSEQFHRLGLSDVELMRRYAALVDDDLPTVLTYVRRRRDEVAEIAEDATPQVISDDEPTVPVSRRRFAGLHVVGARPVG